MFGSIGRLISLGLLVLFVGAWLLACGPLSPAAAAEDVKFEVTVNQVGDQDEEQVKTAPTKTPTAPEHWALSHGESINVRCGVKALIEGDPAGKLDIGNNGPDSIELDCLPPFGGYSGISAIEGDEYWMLPVGGKAYVLCGEVGESLSGPAGEFAIRILGVDVVKLSCNPPFGQ